MIGPSSFCGVSTCAACRKLIWLIFTSPRCRWHRTRPVWYGPRICRWVGLWIFGLQSWIHEIPTKERQQHTFFWRMNSWFCNIRICLKWKVTHPNWNPGPSDNLHIECSNHWATGMGHFSNSSWWRHQMETFSALLAICAGNSPVTGEFPHKGQWRGALLFSLICTRINGWVNNGEAVDLRRHRAHYDVTVMWFKIPAFVIKILCL